MLLSDTNFIAGSSTGQSLLHDIDCTTALLLSEPWTATLRFQGFLCASNSTVPHDEYVVQDHDLFELTKPKYTGWVCRFDPDLYAVVPGGFENNRKVFNALATALMSVSHSHHNCRLTSQGRNWFSFNRYLKCTHHRRYQPKSKAGGDLRTSSMTCDKKNSRGTNGQRMPRRTTTIKAVGDSVTCKVRLMLRVDDASVFMVCGIGSNTHEGHPPISDGILPRRVSTELKFWLVRTRKSKAWWNS